LFHGKLYLLSGQAIYSVTLLPYFVLYVTLFDIGQQYCLLKETHTRQKHPCAE
jgi:hypothetical protein